MLENIKIVLVEPTHPGNIGAVARSMATMGLSDLVLVKPRKFPHYEADKRAAGGLALLQQAQQTDSLASAIAPCSLVVGTSARPRQVSWPMQSPRVAAETICQHLDSVAILFGRESSGLSNDELDLCQFQIYIDANPQYSSLNLASAVQIIAYELRQACQQMKKSAAVKHKPRQQAASAVQKADYLSHLQRVMEKTGFIRNHPPTQLMRKLTRLYNKADLTVEEIQILRGMLVAVEQSVAATDLMNANQ